MMQRLSHAAFQAANAQEVGLRRSFGVFDARYAFFYWFR